MAARSPDPGQLQNEYEPHDRLGIGGGNRVTPEIPSLPTLVFRCCGARQGS